MVEEGKEKMYTEDDFIPIAAIQHYLFCPRQCALIHIEEIWRENPLTVRGRILHEKVDTLTKEKRGVKTTVTSLRVHSFRIGISGICDAVEFHVKTVDGNAVPYPIEYKAGKPKGGSEDISQLCAQALCLEEMLGVEVRQGAMYYGRTRHRLPVEFTDDLRTSTEDAIVGVHQLFETRLTPGAKYGKRCSACSLIEQCMPRATKNKKIGAYMQELYKP
jgi:CRISPR-associated exonuclease Cas4